MEECWGLQVQSRNLQLVVRNDSLAALLVQSLGREVCCVSILVFPYQGKVLIPVESALVVAYAK